MMNIFQKKSKHSGSVVILIVCVILLFISMGSVTAGFVIVGDRTGVGSTYTSGNPVYGGDGDGGGGSGEESLCTTVPEPYRTIFGEANGKWQVQSAFLAATFSIEHGRAQTYEAGYTKMSPYNSAWPEAGGDPEMVSHWKDSGVGAQGPMQFMPGTWSSQKNFAIPNPKHSNGTPDVQSIWDSAFAAAHLHAMNGAGGNTTDLNALRDAASRYNSGRPWSEGQNISETADYVPKVINAYQKFKCEGGGIPTVGGPMDVPFIKQYESGWCGRAAQAMVIAYFDRANLAKYSSYDFISTHRVMADTVKRMSGKNYQYGNPSLDQVIASLNKGYPAIVYTDLYGQHMFVLTGYDGTTFWANDTFGTEARSKNMQTMDGVKLTKSNLQAHLAAQGGHTFIWVP